MKAQSELAGDRKRRAEMTRPRFVGVTNWIDRINDMNHALIGANAMQEAVSCMAGVRDLVAGASFTARIADSIKIPTLPKPIMDSEVNHRPAGQQ